MNVITVFLSTESLPSSKNPFDKMIGISQKVLKDSLKELDKIVGCNTWCFVPLMYPMCDPYPEMTATLEVDDYYYNDLLPEDIIRIFKKHWKEAMNKLCVKK